METNNKRRVMSIAHKIYKNLNEEIIEVVGGANDAWSKCIRYAWSIERFRKALSDGVVVFSYIKADGSMRDARGTLHPMLIPSEKHPKGTGKPNYVALSYFDLDKQDWRGFRITDFYKLVEAYSLVCLGSDKLDIERLPDEDDIIHCSRCGAPMLEGTEEHNTPYGTLCDCCYGDMCG